MVLKILSGLGTPIPEAWFRQSQGEVGSLHHRVFMGSWSFPDMCSQAGAWEQELKPAIVGLIQNI